MKTYIFHVSGTHCQSCKILIEDIISEDPQVKSVTVDLQKKNITVTGNFELSQEDMMDSWNILLKEMGYTLGIEPIVTKKNSDIWIALPIGLAFLMLFFLLQKSGIISINTGGGLTMGGALLVGVIASLSSCLAVIGGLVLSLSSKVAEAGGGIRPIIMFHLGRIGGFFVLGSVLGYIGQSISINFTITSVLGIIVSIIMISLGFNLIGIHIFQKKSLVSRKFFDKLTKIETGFLAPLLVGIGTFFLPCGFTQSMQVASLSSGSWISGGVTMLMFALGTFPVLALLSFGSLSLAHTSFAKLFLKTAGIIVIGLGLFTLLTGLSGLGFIPSFLTI